MPGHYVKSLRATKGRHLGLLLQQRRLVANDGVETGEIDQSLDGARGACKARACGHVVTSPSAAAPRQSIDQCRDGAPFLFNPVMP